MDVALLSPDCLKIKGKNSSIVVDPQALRQKTAADAVLLLRKESFDPSKIEEARVIIEAAGEYEVSGVKISGLNVEGELVFEIQIDGVNLVLGRIESVEKAKEKLKENDLAVLKTDSKFDQSLIAQLAPKIAIFYGVKAKEAIASQFQAETVSKFSIKPEGLPEEMKVVVLSV